MFIAQLCAVLPNTQIVGLSFIAFVELVLSIFVLRSRIGALSQMRKKKEVSPGPVDEASANAEDADASWWVAQ